MDPLAQKKMAKIPDDVTIRAASGADLSSINHIYNRYVLSSTATFELEPVTEESRIHWFSIHQESNYPVLVMTEGESVIGWASLSEYKQRRAYSHTTELSIYLEPSKTGVGHGSRLLAELLTLAAGRGFRAVLGLVCSENGGSIKLLERHGFAKVGELKEVGRKFDRWLDVTFLELLFR